MSDFDGAWKDVLEVFLLSFLGFFFPDILADIDPAQDRESLEQEFHPLAPLGPGGRMLCDKLIRLGLRSRADPMYLHVEMQSYRDDNLDWRFLMYNHRAMDRYQSPVVSLLVLGDDSPNWRPEGFHFEYGEYRQTQRVPARKLLDWEGRDDELLHHENPIGLVVLAHLKALRTRQDVAQRQQWRLTVIRRVYELELDHDDRRSLLGIVESMLVLPAELEIETRQILLQERETTMPLVNSFERIARQEALIEGRQEGEQHGLRRGLLALIRARRWTPDAAFVALVEQALLAALERALEAAETANSLDELRPLLAPINGHP